jgi:hypothetical protein
MALLPFVSLQILHETTFADVGHQRASFSV